MQRPLYRTAAWVLVVVLLASSFAGMLGTAAASTTNYSLNGYVDQGGLAPPPVPAGVTVDLASRATGAVYSTTVTGRGGAFSFTSSGTSNALSPGYWALYVPPAGNVSLAGCSHCAVLPDQQTPQYKFYNSTVLTNASYTQILTNVTVLPYNATLRGNVSQGSQRVAGATVELLDPAYAGLVLSSNTTNATGVYNLSVPFGSWVLQVTHASGSNLYTNTSELRVTSQTPQNVNPVLRAFSIAGRIYSSVTRSYITTAGNATLFDPTNQYLYSTPTPPGGYYSFASYPQSFHTGNQPFDVVVAPVGFQPAWYNLTVNTPGAYTHSVTVSPAQLRNLGWFNTTLNLRAINTTTGRGSIAVNTSVHLGNDTVLPELPNASVGQLWAQLGLDLNRTLNLPAGDVTTAFKTWVTDQGPFFPAVQAGTAINGTTFVGPTAAQGAPTLTTSCAPSTYCGLSSSAWISYAWHDNYTLNGVLPTKAGSYTISFHFAHPASSTEVYNYTLLLPKGYTLYANTVAPAQTSLVGRGAEGSWTNFTLESRQSSTPAATASFTFVRQANFTANVAVSSTNFTFSSRNVLNSTHNNYTVVLGLDENATFSAAPSVYPAGQNGTLFEWNFGDGSTANVTNVTTNHTYLHANTSGVWHGKLTVISSSGLRNSTIFNVSIAKTVPTAGIVSNATSAQNRSAGSNKFLFVPWSTVLQFNATGSRVTSPNNISDALFTLTAKSYSTTTNFSASSGADPFSNWTVSFGANVSSNVTGPGHGLYVNLANVKVNGVPSGVKGYGWVYNLTLRVWSLVGTNSTTTLMVLVNDTEPPVPAIDLRTTSNTLISRGSVVEGANHLAAVRLDGSPSISYGNGSIVNYTWSISNPSWTSRQNFTWYNTSLKPGGQYPTVHLPPKTASYKIKLTVTDKSGISANTSTQLEVAANTTLRPIMEANNLSCPLNVNTGTSYTCWVNVTVGGGTKAVATDIQVWFYLLPTSGTGTKQYIGSSPGSVVFYGYSNTTANATVNSTVLGTGSVASLKYGLTVRADLKWTPSKSGSFILYAYASASNQFSNNTSAGIASAPVTIHTNPLTLDLEYGGIAAGVVIVLAALVLLYRRRTRARRPGGGSKPSSGRSGLERGGKASDEDDDE